MHVFYILLIDQQFFYYAQHPARRLLNLLGSTAIGWVYEDEQSESGYYAKFSSLIMRILKDFHEDVSLFESLYSEFQQFIEIEVHQVEANQLQVIDVVKAKENTKLAQVRVAEVINAHVRNANALPDVVKELLKSGWKDVLTQAYMRLGEESEKWRKLVGLMDTLVWSVQPKTESADRQDLMKTIPELLKSLRTELIDISYDQHKLGVVLKQLQLSHIHALKGKNLTSNEPVGDLISLSSMGQSEEIRPSDEFLQQVEALQKEDWIKWQVASGRTVQGKLIWNSADTGTMVFVSRKGNKLAELMQKELAELLRCQKVTLVPNFNQPLYDRALQSMAEKYKAIS